MRSPDILQNRLLARISASDLALLEGNLHPVDLPLKTNLEAANTNIESCFFLASGVASVVATGKSGQAIEVGLIGSEGVTGSAPILGSTRSPHATFMQVAGSGFQIGSSHLREAMRNSKSLAETLTKFVHTFMVQISQTALVNGKASVDERLARWLLMAHDRVDSPQFHITHEFLALMLGVRRPGVTNALHDLEGKGVIRSKRNELIVLDRRGLEAAAGWSYGVPEAEYARLFGSVNAHAAPLSDVVGERP
jgi:CRP-like cAMP-binding protein